MQERITFEKEIRLAMQQKETEERDPQDPEEDARILVARILVCKGFAC